MELTENIIEKLPYKVKDISLSNWGRKEISLAEAEMPGLMSIRKEFAESLEANSVHGSDSLENAKIEISFFFSKVELV